MPNFAEQRFGRTQSEKPGRISRRLERVVSASMKQL